MADEKVDRRVLPEFLRRLTGAWVCPPTEDNDGVRGLVKTESPAKSSSMVVSIVYLDDGTGSSRRGEMGAKELAMPLAVYDEPDALGGAGVDASA